MSTEFSVETRDASPSHLLLKIESFSLLWENRIEEYESRKFEAGGYKWRLIIYPNGDESVKKRDHISVYLSIVDTNSLPEGWEVNATFNFFLFNQIKNNYSCFRGKVRRFHAINTKWGCSNLMSKKSLTNTANGYLVGDNCVFGAEVFVIKSQRVTERVAVRPVYIPYKHDLVIPRFSELELDGVWKLSEEFTAGEYLWKILLYPNGDERVEGRYVSIYLECVDSASFAPHEKMKAGIGFRVKNKNHDKDHTKTLSHWFSSSAKSCGYSEFIQIDMCGPSKGFVVDGSCFLEIEITIKAVVRDATK